MSLSPGSVCFKKDSRERGQEPTPHWTGEKIPEAQTTPLYRDQRTMAWTQGPAWRATRTHLTIQA